jgi:hypothetical protein
MQECHKDRGEDAGRGARRRRQQIAGTARGGEISDVEGAPRRIADAEHDQRQRMQQQRARRVEIDDVEIGRIAAQDFARDVEARRRVLGEAPIEREAEQNDGGAAEQSQPERPAQDFPGQ